MSLKHTQFDTVEYLHYSAITDVFQTLLSLSDDAQEIAFFNSTDSIIEVQIPKVVNKSLVYDSFLRLPSGGFVYDGRTNSKIIPKGDIKIKYISIAPTKGEFSVTAIR